MPQSHTIPAWSGVLDRPLCPACGTQMWLVHVQPNARGDEEQTFECPVCETHEMQKLKDSQPAPDAPCARVPPVRVRPQPRK